MSVGTAPEQRHARKSVQSRRWARSTSTPSSFRTATSPGKACPISWTWSIAASCVCSTWSSSRRTTTGRSSGSTSWSLDQNVAVFEGASSGLLDDEDVAAAGEAIAPDSAAVLMVIENRWAAPFAMALRRGGAQLVASARLPVQAILAALDASETKG